uniref:Uncharacterized protein n=1 Tax=Brassica oleracea TaxID=3712 RepID=A0A3P6BVH4_BRAOL|nr:unnamed protein product [Brassica oleracea]
MMSQSDNFQSVNSQCNFFFFARPSMEFFYDCNRKAKIERAWTRENPRRRFFGCKGADIWLFGSERHNSRAKGGASRSEEQEKVEECEALKKEVLILGERSLCFAMFLWPRRSGFAILLGGMIVMSNVCKTDFKLSIALDSS